MRCNIYNNHTSVDVKYKSCILLYPDGIDYYSVNFPAGLFKIELWGASGGASTNQRINEGGYGGYVAGIITLNSPQTLYFYIGTQGTDSLAGTPGKGGFNGGANGATDNYNDNCASGGSGGATDVRYLNGTFDDIESLESRIIVAGGGGSGGCWLYGGKGGNAGGLNASAGSNNDSGSKKGGAGGTQNSGNIKGIGEVGQSSNEASGSGGGGYYGGKRGQGGEGNDQSAGGGGGGSSYLSGYPGCTLIEKYQFILPTMISGGNSTPNATNSFNYEEIGHIGDGKAKILRCAKFGAFYHCPPISECSCFKNVKLPNINIYLLFYYNCK